MKKREFIQKASAIGALTITTGVTNLEANAQQKYPTGKSQLVHQVYFWLKKDLTEAQIKTFESGIRSLLKVKTMKYGAIGKPGATADRPVIEKSYSYSLLTIFDDVAGHDAYQVDPIHEQFLKDCKEMWEKVIVYDSTTF
ncbi:MAG: Dabb family protein [Bacteroidota bacterium]|nr:Dabb family protein [Bacteroidota bacterium]